MATANAILAGRNFQDVTGQRFGVYRVVGFSHELDGRPYWSCRCRKCGFTRPLRGDHLTRYVGDSRCLCRPPGKRHGLSRIREYQIWRHMINRCHNPNADNYRFYGARGRYVCQRWRRSYKSFIGDIGNAPSIKHTLDRIDSNGGYTCGKCKHCERKNAAANVRWATKDVQVRNATNNRWYTMNGERLILKDWCRKLGLKYLLVVHRIRRGHSFESAITPGDLRSHRKLRRRVNRP